jgi:DEAD/DEAH box helicase
MGLYIRDVIPFRFLIDPETPRHGFLFADGETPWSTNMMTDILAMESASRISFRLTWGDYRHVAKAIDREFIRGPDAVFDDYDDDNDDENPSEVHDLMHGHSAHVAEIKYGRLTDLTRNVSPESMNLFRDVSDKWQKWLGLISRQPMDDDEEMEIEEQEQQESTEMQLVKAIHDLYGPSKNWRTPEQEKAVVAAVEGVSPLFIIFPTGYGKSSVFLLPAKLKGAGVTIVIVPLIALGDNILETCQKAHIDCIFYGRSPPRMAKVVVVMAETAMRKEFTQYANEIKLMGKLDRIIRDEIHKWKTDTFRPKLMEGSDWSLGVQEVFLTATWPSYMQKKFMREWKIQNAMTIRIPNKKPRVRYTIKIFKDNEFEYYSLFNVDH